MNSLFFAREKRKGIIILRNYLEGGRQMYSSIIQINLKKLHPYLDWFGIGSIVFGQTLKEILDQLCLPEVGEIYI